MSAGPAPGLPPSVNGTQRGPHRPRGLWRSPDFVKLWVSQTVSLTGSQVSLLALPLVAVALGAGALQMGWLAAAQTLPTLLFGLPAGTWIDRLPRRPVLVATDLGQGLVLAAIPVAALLGVLRLELLYPLAFVVSSLAVLAEVAHPAYLPSLVGRERLVEGNSKMALGGQVARIAGPTAAGALVQAATAPLAILADAASFLVSAVLVGTIRAREAAPGRPAARQRLWQEIGEGLAVVLRHPVLRTLTGAWGLYFLFFFLFYSLYVLYATRELGLAPATLGVIVSVASVGGVLGALMTERVTARFGVGPTMAGALLVATAGMLLFPLAGGPTALTVAVLIAAQGLIRTTDQLFYINYLSTSQALTPDGLRGRVQASVRVFTAGTAPIGALVGGFLGEAFGLRATALVAGLGVLVAFAWLALSPIRSIRALPDDGLRSEEEVEETPAAGLVPDAGRAPAARAGAEPAQQPAAPVSGAV
jgi:MFS family permease